MQREESVNGSSGGKADAFGRRKHRPTRPSRKLGTAEVVDVFATYYEK